MATISQEPAEVGVIVGRFQCPFLHDGHKDVIDQVVDKHPRVIIFLGMSYCVWSKENPYPFYVRRQMIEESYPDVEVYGLRDTYDDATWSAALDANLHDFLGPNMTCVLYGGRDSFIKSYKGRYPTAELKAKHYVSATELRKLYSISQRMTQAERVGANTAIQNQYDQVIPAVDVAVRTEDGKYIFIQKPNEDKLRFVGGHAEPDSPSYEYDAIREMKEEIDCDSFTNDMRYLGSFLIDDPRWRKERNKVKTVFFHTDLKGPQIPKAGDDVKGGKVVSLPLDEVDGSMFMPEHVVLYQALKKWHCI